MKNSRDNVKKDKKILTNIFILYCIWFYILIFINIKRYAS